MKTIIKIINKTEIENRKIIDVKFIEGNRILKGDIFYNGDIEFAVENVGIINSSLDNIYPLTVRFNSEIEHQKLKDTLFVKK